MSRALRRLPSARTGLAALAGAVLCALAAAGCGGETKVADPDRPVARLFVDRCSGCHTLKLANSYGSKPEGELEGGDRTNGPNFSVRHVDKEAALFAIRNGGYSGAIMPANLVVGKDAERMAAFLEKYSGKRDVKSAAGRGGGP